MCIYKASSVHAEYETTGTRISSMVYRYYLQFQGSYHVQENRKRKKFMVLYHSSCICSACRSEV